MYSHDTPAAPLPPYLTALASHFASLAAASGPSDPSPLQQRLPTTHCPLRKNIPLNHSSRKFEPDAALVNYYWQGELTLSL